MSQIKQGAIYCWDQQTPPTLSQIVTDLRAAQWLLPNQSWWFAWQELKIQLPSRLPKNLSLVEHDAWDVLHLFSADVECRRIRRGQKFKWLLLAEKALPDPIASAWTSIGSYCVVSSRRIMWGNRLRLPAQKEPYRIEEGRGVVSFPRRLDYDVQDEEKNYQKALIADVKVYYDNEACLRTVRYTQLRHLEPGHDSARTQTLSQVMENFPIQKPSGATYERSSIQS